SRIRIDRRAPMPLGTSWRDGNKIRGNIFFDPQILLVPLYHKIRVPVTSVISTLVALDQWIETGRTASLINLKDRVVWELALCDNATLKEQVFKDASIVGNFRSTTLRDDMPRYIWRAAATSNGARLFELLYDATDLLQGGHMLGGLPYSRATCVAIAAIA